MYRTKRRTSKIEGLIGTMGFVLVALALWGAPGAEIPQWTAPPACPQQGVVEQWIDRLMLERTEDVPSWQGRVEVSDEAGFVLTLTVAGQARTVSDPDCAALAVAAALVVAVAADPVVVVDAIDAELQRPQPAPPLVEAPHLKARPEPAAPNPRPPRRPELMAPDPTSDVSGVASGAIGAEFAVLPQPGFAVSLAGGVRWSWLRVELVGLLSAPRDVPARETNLGARAAVAGGQVRGCWVVPAPPVEVPLCLAGEVGGVWARGFGPSIEPQAKVQPWAAVVPSLGVTGWLSARFGLEARISAPVGLYKPAVHLVEGGDVHVFRAGSVGARLWVGPVVRFP